MRKNEYKILIVDDEDDILEIINYNLSKEGYQVYVANHADKGMELARTHIPHLIILDVMMPEKDGIQLCKELREIPFLNHTIIAFFSARGEEHIIKAALDSGGEHYFTKPITPKEFSKQVENLIQSFLSKPNKPLVF